MGNFTFVEHRFERFCWSEPKSAAGGSEFINISSHRPNGKFAGEIPPGATPARKMNENQEVLCARLDFNIITADAMSAKRGGQCCSFLTPRNRKMSLMQAEDQRGRCSGRKLSERRPYPTMSTSKCRHSSCSFPPGKSAPCPELFQVHELYESVNEVLRLPAEAVPLRASMGVEAEVALARSGTILEPNEIADVASALEGLCELREWFCGAQDERKAS